MRKIVSTVIADILAVACCAAIVGSISFVACTVAREHRRTAQCRDEAALFTLVPSEYLKRDIAAGAVKPGFVYPVTLEQRKPAVVCSDGQRVIARAVEPTRAEARIECAECGRSRPKTNDMGIGGSRTLPERPH